MVTVYKFLSANGSIIFYSMASVMMFLIIEYFHILHGLNSDYKRYKELLKNGRF